MDRHEFITHIDNIRQGLQTLMMQAPSPAIERLMQDADIQCHTALWLLGETRGMTPEGEWPTLEENGAGQS